MLNNILRGIRLFYFGGFGLPLDCASSFQSVLFSLMPHIYLGYMIHSLYWGSAPSFPLCLWFPFPLPLCYRLQPLFEAPLFFFV